MLESRNLYSIQVALFVVAICAFGIPMAWAAPERDERGKMSVEKMVFEVSTSILARSRLPAVAYKLGNEKLAFSNLGSYAVDSHMPNYP
jgi:hypothetical protein